MQFLAHSHIAPRPNTKSGDTVSIYIKTRVAQQDTSLDGGKIEFWGVSLIMVVSCVRLFIVFSCHMTEFDPRSSSNIRCKGGSCWQYDQTKFMGLGDDLFALEQSECLLPKMQAT